MAPNKVLIKRSGLQDSRFGFCLADSETTEHKLLPNIGEVIAVCDTLRFTWDTVDAMKACGSPTRAIQEEERASCRHLTEIEVKPGDRVVYRRMMNWSDMDNIASGGREMANIVIEHDDLIAIIRPGNTLYPVAGNVLVEIHDSPFARIVAAGLPVLKYFDWPNYSDFSEALDVDDIVAINPKQSAPIGTVPLVRGVAAFVLAYENILDPIEVSYIKRRHITAKYETQP